MEKTCLHEITPKKNIYLLPIKMQDTILGTRETTVNRKDEIPVFMMFQRHQEFSLSKTKLIMYSPQTQSYPRDFHS